MIIVLCNSLLIDTTGFEVGTLNGLTVMTIGDYSFGECSSLTTIDIPSSVTSLGYYAFSGCNNLTEIIINRKHDGTLSDAPWGGDEDSFGRKKTIKVIWLDETVLYE